jgi:hypothetical protein
VADGVGVVGVPVICPFPVLKLNPAGSAGEMLHVATAPPVLVGDHVEIAVFGAAIKVVGEYAITGGWIPVMLSVIVVLAGTTLPTPLSNATAVAVTVFVPESKVVVFVER